MTYPSTTPRKIKGFTLIEFMVASVLAIIVIMAAGGTYFMTRRLNSSAQQRLDIQQNLRNAALQITRDARLAGNFGCYSTGNNSTIVPDIIAPDFSSVVAPHLAIDTTKADSFGIHKGLFDGQPALFFVYGQGESAITAITGLSTNKNNNLTALTLAAGSPNTRDNPNLDALRQTLSQGGYAVLSSCRNAVGFRAPKTNNQNVALPAALNNVAFSTQDSGTITLSRLHATAYVFNQANKQLFRVELDDNGNQWKSPQLISGGINSMDIGFGYTEGCPAGFSDAPSTVPETFTFSNDTTEVRLPATVQIRLNYDLDTQPATAKPPAAKPKITTADYVINATVRGGNTCGNRIPVKKP